MNYKMYIRNLNAFAKITFPQRFGERGIKILKSSIRRPPNYKDVIMPEEKLLPPLDSVPTMPNNVSIKKVNKKLEEMRGPELIHNRLIFKQYGIAALCGGHLKPSHIENIRTVINKHIDPERMFAVWRIDPPWKPITKKSSGKKLGAGKGNIKDYVTPIKAGRIIMEMGGFIEFDEVRKLLDSVARILPLDAIPVHNETFQQIEEEEKLKNEQNANPLTLKYCIENNFLNCHTYIGKYDKLWFGKYV